MKYRKKPVVIEAEQFNNSADIHEFCGECCREPVGEDYMEIITLEGIMKASKGDYIIQGVNGEFYPCKPDIFEKTYDKAVDEIVYGGFCGGGMSHHINLIKVHENTLGCPVCGKPLYIQEASGIAVCSDVNCEYGHTQ